MAREGVLANEVDYYGDAAQLLPGDVSDSHDAASSQADGADRIDMRVESGLIVGDENDAFPVDPGFEKQGHLRISDRRDALTQSDIATLDAILSHEISENTKRSYETQWRRFVSWSERKGVRALPSDPVHVALYLAERMEVHGHKPATLRAAAVSFAHRAARVDDPCATLAVKNAIRSATRKAGRIQRQAQALTANGLQRIRDKAGRQRVGRNGKLENPQSAKSGGRPM